MEPNKIKKEIQGKTVKQEDQAFQEVPAPEDNDISNNYILSRQVAHEFNSPALEALKKYGNNIPESTGNSKQKEYTGSPDLPLEEPWIDPTMAFSGGFGGAAKMSLSAGVKLLPSLGRAMASGVIGAITEYPLGKATEAVEKIAPAVALPFSVITGLISGVTLESRLEKVVVKALSKGGIKPTQEAITQGIERAKVGLESGAEDQLSKDILSDLNALPEIKQSEELKQLGVKKKVEVELTPEGEARLKDIMGDINKPISELIDTSSKAKTFLEPSDLPKDKALNINLNRIETADDIKKMLSKTADLFPDELDSARRGVRSNKMTEKTASLLGMTPEQLLRRRRGQAFNAEEAVAARRILVSSAEKIKGLAQKAIMGDDFDQFEFRKALNVHYAIQAQVSGMTSEAGRSLQSFNIKSKSSQVSVKKIGELLKNLPLGMTTKDLAAAVSTIDSVEGITTFARQAQRATTKDMFMEAWINGLLSGPQTHAVNTLSNSLVALWQIPERFLASGIGRVLPGDQAIREGEAISQAFGLVEGFKDGLKSFGKVVKTGVPTDELSKIEMSTQRSITADNIRQLPLIQKIAPDALENGGVAARAVDMLGEAIRVPGRMLMAEDEFFKSIGYRMELNARAYRKTVEEGLSGETASRRIREIISDPETHAPDVHLAAITAARYQTFTKELGAGGKNLQSMVGNIPGLRLIIPFIRTPTNILKFAGERTPLAALSKNVRAEITAGGARRDLALAKMSMGSMVMATVAAFSAEGYITGGGPTDPELKSVKYNTGWQPYSLKIKDKYYAYNRLEPLGMLFGLAADATEIIGQMDEDDRNDLASAIVMSISKNVVSKTWLEGLSNAISALEDPDRYSSKFLQNYAKTLIPTGVSQVAREIDPTFRDINSYLDAVKSRIPGYSKDLPPRRNIWGEKITMEGGLGPDIISPIYTKTEKDSPIDDELLRLKFGPSMPKEVQSLRGIPIKLNPKEYDRFMEIMNTIKIPNSNKNLKNTLNNMVTNDNLYKRLKDDDKELFIRSMISQASELARLKIVEEFPELNGLINIGQNQLRRDTFN